MSNAADVEVGRLDSEELQEALGEDWLAVADDEVDGRLAVVSGGLLQESHACSPVASWGRRVRRRSRATLRLHADPIRSRTPAFRRPACGANVATQQIDTKSPHPTVTSLASRINTQSPFWTWANQRRSVLQDSTALLWTSSHHSRR